MTAFSSSVAPDYCKAHSSMILLVNVRSTTVNFPDCTKTRLTSSDTPSACTLSAFPASKPRMDSLNNYVTALGLLKLPPMGVISRISVEPIPKSKTYGLTFEKVREITSAEYGVLNGLREAAVAVLTAPFPEATEVNNAPPVKSPQSNLNTR